MLNNKFNEVIKNLEKNIDSEKDLKYAKEQVIELTMVYLAELGNIEKIYNKNLKIILKRISDLEEKIEKFDEENEVDVEPISCPYCNMNFLIEYDSNNTEVKCPECKNIIELNWEKNSDEDM